jgi:hypothetical protein
MCRIGGRTKPIEISYYIQYRLENNQVLINAIQSLASQREGALQSLRVDRPLPITAFVLVLLPATQGQR